MFLGWYDPDRHKSARVKLAEAIARYGEKFGRTPKFCLTSAQDAAELAEPSRRFAGELPVQVQGRSYIARFTYYVGEDAGEEENGSSVSIEPPRPDPALSTAAEAGRRGRRRSPSSPALLPLRREKGGGRGARLEDEALHPATSKWLTSPCQATCPNRENHEQ